MLIIFSQHLRYIKLKIPCGRDPESTPENKKPFKFPIFQVFPVSTYIYFVYFIYRFFSLTLTNHQLFCCLEPGISNETLYLTTLAFRRNCQPSSYNTNIQIQLFLRETIHRCHGVTFEFSGISHKISIGHCRLRPDFLDDLYVRGCKV